MLKLCDKSKDLNLGPCQCKNLTISYDMSLFWFCLFGVLKVLLQLYPQQFNGILLSFILIIIILGKFVKITKTLK